MTSNPAALPEPDRRIAMRGPAAVATLLLATATSLAVMPVWSAPVTTPEGCSVPAAPQLDLATSAARHDRSPATPVAYPQPARNVLRDLAATTTTSPCDTISGRYDLIRYLQWREDPSWWGRLREVVRWHADDRSGAQLTTHHPPGPAPVGKGWWNAGHIPHHIPTDTMVNPLFRFLTSDLLLPDSRSDVHAAEALRAVADLATWHTLRRDDRAAVLTVLARHDRLVYYPRVSDRAGRVGVAITATDNDGHRSLLIVHPTTGDILAYETARPDRAGGWRPTSYLLMLGHSRVNVRWWEPPHPPPPAPLHPQRARVELHVPATLCLPTAHGDAR
ncbi:hypothetical protein ACFFMR_26185 [Micromonospora andamanensis]|uniref:Uncharacterized protein n=1 Tax=Micromonospora andamanensis TaxID=1287068 RepID=A0ABQ4HS53_9ACTN|nr:hypothetical protein [Micromonospora andamanensis]GIJ08461.1 hypothetical protein Van01_16750 [Micromonospora andamanensis]